MTIWRGAPSGPIVDSTAHRGADRNSRTGSIRRPPSLTNEVIANEVGAPLLQAISRRAIRHPYGVVWNVCVIRAVPMSAGSDPLVTISIVLVTNGASPSS
jgi:hypothetical protein